LRVTLSALHREDEVEALLDAVAAAMATLEREPETGAASSAGKGARRSRAGRVRQQRPDPARGRA
jgi:isoaspartyl peptidase/L-asparaginase-like protein (Ntn-hydrolase superfamily)